MNDFTSFPIHQKSFFDFVDLGAVSDGSKFAGIKSGVGLFNAAALRSYVIAGIAPVYLSVVADFGAVGDGVTNNDAAFAAARAAVVSGSSSGVHVELVFPAGVYLYTVSPNWAVNNTTYTAHGEVRLQYSGTGNAWIFDGGDPAAVSGIRVRGNFIIQAPPTALDGVYIRACHHCWFEFKVRGCGTSSSGVHVLFCVCSEFRVVVSNNEDLGGWYLSAKPLNGLCVDIRGALEPTSYCTFPMPILEGVDVGIAVLGGYGNLFLGGTAEGCSTRGVQIAANNTNNKFIGMDFESNVVQDIYCQGNYNSFIECDSQSQITFDTPGLANRLIGGNCFNITTGAGAASSLFMGVHWNRTGGATINDNGTLTRFRDIYDTFNGIHSNSPPAQSGITVGASPFTYTNNTGNDQTVMISGGTVSAVLFVRLASANSLGVTAGTVLLSPGDGVTVTYSVAPTMRLYSR